MSLPKELEFIRLGWDLLECKAVYYHPTLVHDSWKENPVTDWEYDLKEKRYKELAEELGLTPTATLVGFDPYSASGRLIISKISLPIGSKELLTGRKK